LDVDLSVVKPSGKGGVVTTADVERAAKTLAAAGEVEPLRGVRRAMAQNMALAHAEVVPATVVDDADVNAWRPDADGTMRLVRAIAIACRVAPALNTWFDNQSLGRRIMHAVHVGIAVDTADGLFVPVLRDVGDRDEEGLRTGLERLKADVRERKIPPEEMRGYTIMLSNFGMLGGRYAVPVVVPPTVAILGAGRISEQVIAVDGAPAVHRILPLSLTFDHRAVTGGEAARFLAAVIADLETDG